MDATILNQTVDTSQLSGIWYYTSAIPKFLTEQITENLKSLNFQVTDRWSSTLLLFISFGLLYLGISVLKKVHALVKIILVALALILLAGVLVPFW